MTLRWRLGGLERMQAQVWWGRGGCLNWSPLIMMTTTFCRHRDLFETC